MNREKKTYQIFSSHKTAGNSSCCRIFSPQNNFVRQNIVSAEILSKRVYTSQLQAPPPTETKYIHPPTKTGISHSYQTLAFHSNIFH